MDCQSLMCGAAVSGGICCRPRAGERIAELATAAGRLRGGLRQTDHWRGIAIVGDVWRGGGWNGIALNGGIGRDTGDHRRIRVMDGEDLLSGTGVPARIGGGPRSCERVVVVTKTAGRLG